MPRKLTRKKIKKLARIKVTYSPERRARLVEEGPQQSIVAFVDTGLEQCIPNDYLKKIVIQHVDDDEEEE
jgi:hypothetical protein